MGGGVGVIFKNSIKLISSTSVNLSDSDTIILTLLTANNLYLRIILIYRPPSSSYLLFLDNINDIISSMSNTSNTIILGDFNIHINKNNKMAYDLSTLMESHSFKQLVMSITHTSGNTIDLVFIKDDPSLNITMNPTNHLITDHYAISFTIQYPIRNKHINTLISYLNISRISISDYTKDLLTITIYTYYDITATKRNSYLSISNNF